MKYAKLLRRMRQRIFDYDGTSKEVKALRVLLKIKARYTQSAAFKAEAEAARQQLSDRMWRLWA